MPADCGVVAPCRAAAEPALPLGDKTDEHSRECRAADGAAEHLSPPLSRYGSRGGSRLRRPGAAPYLAPSLAPSLAPPSPPYPPNRSTLELG